MIVVDGSSFTSVWSCCVLFLAVRLPSISLTYAEIAATGGGRQQRLSSLNIVALVAAFAGFVLPLTQIVPGEVDMKDHHSMARKLPGKLPLSAAVPPTKKPMYKFGMGQQYSIKGRTSTQRDR